MNTQASEMTSLEIADLLESNATIGLHQVAAQEIRRLTALLDQVREEGYSEGRRHALYEARNAHNEKFGL